MPIQTQDSVEKYYRTKRREIYLRWGVVIAAGIIIFLSIRGCRNEKATTTRIEAMQKRIQDLFNDSARIESVARGYKRSKEDMDLRYQESRDEINLMRKALSADGEKMAALAQEIKKASKNKDTGTLVNKCPELAEKVEHYEAWLHETWAKETELDKLQNAALRATDSLARHWEKAYRSCLSAAEYVATELPKIKPKGKLYIDGAVKFGAITGIGGGFSYLDKKGNKFSPKVSFTNMGEVYEIGYGRLLSFKRK